MLDINFIKENLELIKKNNKNRGMVVDVDRLLSLDDGRREIIGEMERLRNLRNKGSKSKPTPPEIEEMKSIGLTIKELENNLSKILNEYNILLLSIPNISAPDSPVGGEEDFVVIEEVEGRAPSYKGTRDHEDILTTLDLIDFERGAKVVGSKFYYSKGDLVKLNMALLNYGMSIGEKYGFTLMETPDLAKNDIILGAGFNPRGEETQIYNIENTDLSLIGTAEITMLGFHADEVLDLTNGPKKYMALSHCFRTEGGAYGRTSKGLYRVHQFTKLEMFIFCKPEDSPSLHKELLSIEREICDGLGFPYRVIDVPTADLGAPAYKKYDIEARMVMVGSDSEAGYGEITSTSNCTDYQARRLNIRYKNVDNKNEFVHTLNGTAIVLSRFPIAIVENFQTEDGRIEIPKVLRAYMGKDFIG